MPFFEPAILPLSLTLHLHKHISSTSVSESYIFQKKISFALSEKQSYRKTSAIMKNISGCKIGQKGRYTFSVIFLVFKC